MPVPMFPVESSQISYIGFDADCDDLYVTFLNGAVWAYHNVSKDVFDELKNNSSVGRYFSNNIKDKYSCDKIK